MDAPKPFDDLLREAREALEKLDETLAQLAAGDQHFRPVPTVLKAMRKAS